MRHFRGSLLIASLLAGAPLLAVTAQPAQAQFSASIGFDSFHATLSDYGDWLYSDRWGEVWRPLSQDRDDDWRPYWAGHWASTREYGWTWISDEGDWGDITYHYGRWVYDPDDGWLWLPGYVWSPAWVVWRSSGPDVGWMPMPPDNGFLGPSFSISIGFGDWNDIGGYYGYSRWYGSSFDRARFGRLWTFVPGDRLADPGYRRYALARPQTINIIQNSRNITNYTVVNNVIVNRSVNTTVVNRGGRAPQPVAANTVLRSTRWVAPVNQGEQIQARARQDRPRGNGQVGSAPPPTPQQIRTLSTRAVPTLNAAARTNAGAGNENRGNDNRGGPRHLFSQANAQELAARRGGQQPNTAAPNAPAPQPNAQPARPGAAEPDRNRDNAERNNNGRDNNGRDNNLRNDNRRTPDQALPGTLPPAPGNPPPQAERPQALPSGRPAPSDNPSAEDRGGRGPADRPPRTLSGQQPPAMNERPPQPDRAAPPREMPPPREQIQREQPQRDQPQREQPQRSMEQRMPPPERAAPREMPREAPPPREAPREQARPQAQPREQAPPREQARPNDRGQDRGRGNGRDRPDDNR